MGKNESRKWLEAGGLAMGGRLWVSLSIIGLGIVVWLIMPSSSRLVSTRVLCASALRQIGTGIALYANEHEGKYPVDLRAMLKEEDVGMPMVLCPGEGRTMPTTYPSTWADTDGDYVYVGEGLRNGVPADVVVAYERRGVHGGGGMNVLFGDGRVEFVGLREFSDVMGKSDLLREGWEK